MFDKLFLNSDKGGKMRISVPIPHAQPAVTMKGVFDDFSSEELHAHGCHQLLVIRNGVSVLIDDALKQPLFGELCAFLPAGCRHRNVVQGGSVAYQSVYVKRSVFPSDAKGVVVFALSGLGMALFDALADDPKQDFRSGVAGDSLRLFLRVVSSEMTRPTRAVRLPRPVSVECGKLVDYLESRFPHRIKAEDFSSVLPYSFRHISRLFRDEMKMTLFEYLRGVRMLQASVLLHDPARSVLDTALSCGYESLSAFYADFSRYFSGTPKRMRSGQEKR